MIPIIFRFTTVRALADVLFIVWVIATAIARGSPQGIRAAAIATTSGVKESC
jgi:hypothetical protein